MLHSALSDAAFAARHSVMRVILWLHVPLVAGVAIATGEGTSGPHAAAAVREVAERLASVTTLQRQIRAVMTEQATMTSHTRELVLSAAEEVASSARRS